jgi:hypothetical protein
MDSNGRIKVNINMKFGVFRSWLDTIRWVCRPRGGIGILGSLDDHRRVPPRWNSNTFFLSQLVDMWLVEEECKTDDGNTSVFLYRNPVSLSSDS